MWYRKLLDDLIDNRQNNLGAFPPSLCTISRTRPSSCPRRSELGTPAGIRRALITT